MVVDGRVVQSVDRALALLEALGKQKHEVSIEDIAKQVDLKVATAYNLLETLRRRGYVLQIPGRRQYQLGLKIMELAQEFDPKEAISLTILPLLRQLSEHIAETVYLSMPIEGGINKICAVESVQLLATRATLGEDRQELTRSSAGKMIMAYWTKASVRTYIEQQGLKARTPHTITDLQAFFDHLEQIRRQGYALNLEEDAIGICGVSVPICRENRLLLVITASLPSARSSDQVIERIITSLIAYAPKFLTNLGLVP